jgi:hypothetical protein
MVKARNTWPPVPFRERVSRFVRPLVCAAVGHRDVRILLHRQVCDKPWHPHTGAEPSMAFCFWCDSGELDKARL